MGVVRAGRAWLGSSEDKWLYGHGEGWSCLDCRYLLPYSAVFSGLETFDLWIPTNKRNLND